MTAPLGLNPSLADWLAWQETAHTQAIDLTLDRVAAVFQKLSRDWVTTAKTITVAGTNGKGSSVAMLEAIYKDAGYRTGVYTTPHLLRYNERIRVDQTPVSDELLCHAFTQIDEARGDISLSYFEFGTLAALLIFHQANVDVQILEVGLGGRLDAVNIIDADAALITTIDLDHAEWLGTDRSQIAVEKAGVFRPDQVAVCADPTVPNSLPAVAKELGTRLTCAGSDFGCQVYPNRDWALAPDGCTFSPPGLSGDHQYQNAAGVVALVRRLNETLPVQFASINRGLSQAKLGGRLQQLSSEPAFWLDVAHNPESARALASWLRQQTKPTRRVAIFGAMLDKDLEQIVEPMLDITDAWYVVGLPIARAAKPEVLEAVISQLRPDVDIRQFANVQEALDHTRQTSSATESIIAFGSFYLAEACLRAL